MRIQTGESVASVTGVDKCGTLANRLGYITSEWIRYRNESRSRISEFARTDVYTIGGGR